MIFRQRSMHSRVVRGTALLSLAWFSSPAQCTEGGGSAYAVGVETNLAGLMVPEGLHTFLYYQHYNATRSKDNAGNDNARLAYFETEVNTVALRLSYVWPGVQFLGASVETRLGVPVPSVDLSLGVKLQ